MEPKKDSVFTNSNTFQSELNPTISQFYKSNVTPKFYKSNAVFEKNELLNLLKPKSNAGQRPSIQTDRQGLEV